MLIPEAGDIISFLQTIDWFLRYIGYKNVIILMLLMAVAFRVFDRNAEG